MGSLLTRATVGASLGVMCSLPAAAQEAQGNWLIRATGTERAGNRPERTTYEITPEGREALRRRVESGLEKFVYEYPLFPVVLSEAHNLEAEDALLRLRRRVADLDNWLAELNDAIAAAQEQQVPERYWIAADYLRHQVTGERDWLASVTERIESKDLPWLHRNDQ